MEVVKNEMKSLRRRFDNQEKELKRFLGLSPVEQEAVGALYEVFCELQSEMQLCGNKLTEQMRNEDQPEQEINEEHDRIDGYRFRYKFIKQKVDKLIHVSDEKTRSIGSESVSGEMKRSVKLPTVQIKKFDGTRTEWLGFWAQFQRIHEHPELHDSEKFWYLVDSLKAGSEAYELASLYPQSDENYPKVIEALKRKFGNEDMLLQVYIRELLSLVISNVSSRDKLPFQTLFMKVDSHLRALKTLKLENADPETWLYPLVESSLPEKVLYNWQHSPLSSMDGKACDPPKSRLDLLLEFMENEVTIHQKIQFAKEFSHGAAKNQSKSSDKKHVSERESSSKVAPATVAAFQIHDKQGCLFCGRKNHSSQSCRYARRLPYVELKKKLIEKNACFRCFDTHHKSADCTFAIKCDTCGSRHHTLMCGSRKETGERDKSFQRSERNTENSKEQSGYRSNDNWNQERRDYRSSSKVDSSRLVGQKEKRQEIRGVSSEPSRKKSKSEGNISKSHVAISQACTAVVYSQTLLVKLRHGSQHKIIRVFLDTGSKRSYIRKDLAKELGFIPFAKEKVIHTLFGGVETEPTEHGKYNIRIQAMMSSFICNLTVRDKDLICHPLERVPLTDEIKSLLDRNEIVLTDVGKGSPPIDLLIGSDFYGKVITNGVRNLGNGLVAINTKLGWTVVGERKEDLISQRNVALCMAVHDKEVPHLWELELLGIRDPVEVLTGKELAESIQNKFLRNVERKADGRYLVSLSWKENHPFLPSNRDVAVKRLDSTTKKLIQNKMFTAYDDLFKEWLSEGFIEKVTREEDSKNTHYLPHRAVIKNSLTTPVRPVFDASCKRGKSPSLNDCLQKGCNFILKIPDILARFRENEIGFTSDIRKAFQMIEVKEGDRDSFRFLWWKSEEMTEIEVYRHVRVPFGATCSPFILGAVLKLHLSNVSEQDEKVARSLMSNFYVDNCVSSACTVKEYELFKESAIRILSEAQMDLRMWLSNVDSSFPPETKVVSVLGLMWNRKEDELFIDSSKLTMPEKFTKRSTLSVLQKIFDPIGFTCPVTLLMKVILQKSWANKLKWDEPIPESEAKVAALWCQDLTRMGEIKIPRLMKIANGLKENWSVHVFTDASKDAYATAVFLRSELDKKINVQLLGAKSRITPPKQITIPRLELLGSLIGTVLYYNIKKALDLESVPVYFWCDSTTVLAWIRRHDQWGTFVGNRIKKILDFSRVEDWRYVPSALNAADLPSRGCSPKELLESRWWEGPLWLQSPKHEWPSCPEVVDENKVEAEKKVTTLNVSISLERQLKVDLSFNTWTRVTGWINRFIFNCRNRKSRRHSEILSEQELAEAEITLIKVIQRESLDEKMLRKANLFELIRDQEGVLRVKTRILQREDLKAFKFPAILPGKHPIVRRLISDLHLETAHAGAGILLSKLRERFWILQGRRTVQKILFNCFRCRRFSAKPILTETASLPINRVKDGDPFEVTGVDLAGPLFLRNGKKVWMVIFTCALYRAVHLRLVDSLTTKAFIKCMSEFVKQFRRPSVVYSDNGTNFKGAENLFSSLNWKEIKNEEGLEKINWIFNPSTAAWWGGFWERLIRSAKDLVRRTLGKALLKKQELEVLLKTMEKSLNDRPLTYVSENPNDLEPLTPNLFLHPLGPAEFPEKDMCDAEKLRFRLKYMKTLQNQLKSRWRNEYLGLLVGRKQKSTRSLKIGELVVVSTENRKRVEWPLARILELIPSESDGISRVARIKTENGIFIRPVQRLHPLEAEVEEESKKLKEIVTRSGRVVKPPVRFE